MNNLSIRRLKKRKS